MSKTKEALQMALDALEKLEDTTRSFVFADAGGDSAIAAIREALAETEQEQDDIEVIEHVRNCHYKVRSRHHLENGDKLYTHPAPANQQASDAEQSFKNGYDTGYEAGVLHANQQARVQDTLISRLCNARMIAADRLPSADVDAIDEAISALANIRRLAETQAMLAAAPEAPAPAQWQELSDQDRQEVFESMPDMLEGFLKKWGWLHFAKGIEEKCRAKNGATK